LLHFVGVASWSDERVLAKVREMVLPAIERQGPIEAWIIDDTGFPKQGTHSVGVLHQYCVNKRPKVTPAPPSQSTA
jgi:SRSO17 transposase